MSHQFMNGGLPIPAGHGNQQTGPGSQGNRSMISPSSGSSFSVLSNQTGQSNNGLISPLQNGTQSSFTDVSLEQAMEKVQELATENATLREYLKENNENMKRQFQMLLQWKEKVRESNRQNLLRFEQLHRQINVLKLENEKYKQVLDSPDREGSVLEELQSRIRDLEEEKFSLEKKMLEERQKVENLKSELINKSPDTETALVSTAADESEVEGYKKRCMELASQVHNFHQQNEQLLQDLQHVNTLKVQIQTENVTLNEQNLVLQKQLQGLFGDINKTRYSVGPGAQEIGKNIDTGPSNNSENSERKETESSITSRTDIEILAMQTAAADRQTSMNEEFMSGIAEELKEKLQIEKERTSKQTQKLSSQEVEITRLQSQLSEREQMLGHYKEQLDSQIAHITQEHKRQQQDLLRQLDMLNSELQQTKSSLPYQGDVQNLKSQVMTLIKESQELSVKLDVSAKALDKKSARVVELEQHVCRREEDFQQSRREMDSIVQQLKYSLSTSEDTINRERREHATTKKQLMELRASFNQLVNDYKELLDTFDEYKAAQQHQQPGTQNKQMMDEINRLTAQTIAAEEAITYRDEQIKELKTENARLKDDIDNTIPVLRAQADLWKQDFDAERYARERQVAEKESILQEMRNLELKNQQLIDELESYSRKSLAEMQRRHAAPSYQQQLQSHLQPGNQGPPLGYYQPTQTPGQQPQQTSPRAGYQYGSNIAYSPPQPVEHASGDDTAQRPQDNVPQPTQLTQPTSHSSSSSHQEEGDNPLTCPKCGIPCPDLDSLQIHVLDCLDN
ncbi:optineurin-like [Mercenaria mercenaria]|uniref:optineurin-like n=1 Tax=Mercenaria mercenaria TaxID=6596 RepID=UPI00234E947D|nr:optineurin-like [Mercenaria mercenaria]XP_045167334.2 optineurin-like [Mercenaria mercenaria]